MKQYVNKAGNSLQQLCFVGSIQPPKLNYISADANMMHGMKRKPNYCEQVMIALLDMTGDHSNSITCQNILNFSFNMTSFSLHRSRKMTRGCVK